jgi:O-antigen/teichoic acid export membrane protein
LGIVRKQALANSIFSYIGVGLGYLNVIILFPAFFTSDEFGLLSLIISVSVIYAYLSAIGLANTIPRFFPFFKTDDKLHNGFMSYILLIGVAGFLIITILFIVLRPLIISAYIEKSAEFVNYYYFLIPLSLFTLLYNVFEAIARAIYKTSFATFLKETLLRLLTTIGIILFMFKILNFNQFIYFYVIINCVCAILLLFQTIFSKEFVFKFNFKDLTKEKFKELMKYGGFLYISSASMIIGQSGADTLFLGSMVGLSIVGAYTIYMRIATLIYVPMRSLSKISVPVIANCFKENDLKQISDIYKRTSLIQLIIGCLIYIGVIINKHNLFYFLKKPEYIESFNIFYFVGIAVLIDIAVGLNSEIIVNSPKYKFDPLFNIILLIVSISANYFLIPVFGGVGAALAAIASFFTFNFIKWLFLVINFKMQPLDYRQLIVIGIAIISYFIGNAIPIINNIFIDAIVRSGITVLIYGGLTVLLKVSPDLNERYVVYKNLIKNFFTTKNT